MRDDTGELTAAEEAILDAVAEGHLAAGGTRRSGGRRRPWTLRGALVAAGHDPDAVDGLVAPEAVVKAGGGWLQAWDGWAVDGGPNLSLTPRAMAVLGLDVRERWEKVTTREPEPRDPDGRGKFDRAAPRTRRAPGEVRAVANLTEVGRFAPAPPPRNPGDPMPKKVPIVLPERFSESRLPDWVTRDMLDRPSREPDPADAAVQAEEYAMVLAVTEGGEFEFDPDTGEPRRVPLVIQGQQVKVDRRMGRRPGRKAKDARSWPGKGGMT